MLGPSISTLQCHSSPLCGVGAIPSLSALRYRDVSIPPPFGGARARPSLSGLRCWGHPSPLCGANHLHSAVSVRSHPSPLYGIVTLPSLHRSAVLGRDHPSPVCGAGAIPLHSAVSVRSHPSPLYGIGTFPSLHRSAVLGRDHPYPVCGAGDIHLHSAVPTISTLRCRCDPIPLRSTVSLRFHPSTVRRC